MGFVWNLAASRGGAQQQEPSVSLAGTWEGEIRYDYAPAKFYLWDLVQKGTAVTGKSRIIAGGTGGSPGPERSVVGTIESNKLSLTVPSLANAGYELMIEGDTMKGTYRSTSGPVAPLSGNRGRK